MDKFLEKINEEAETLANAYVEEQDVDDAKMLLEQIDIRLSILSHAQDLKVSSITADFTEQMQEKMKDIDYNNVDFNSLLKQLSK
jgi:hypothetical protein